MQIDEKMIVRGIKTAQMNFIGVIFNFNKNYERLVDFKAKPGEPDSSESDDDTKIIHDPIKRQTKLSRY